MAAPGWAAEQAAVADRVAAAREARAAVRAAKVEAAAPAVKKAATAAAAVAKVGRCRLTPREPRVDCVWFPRLHPKYDEPLLNCSFNFNLRRYVMAATAAAKKAAIRAQAKAAKEATDAQAEVGQCRLTLSDLH
jgi:hypothetical protein